VIVGKTARLFVDTHIDFIRQFHHEWGIISSPTAKNNNKIVIVLLFHNRARWTWQRWNLSSEIVIEGRIHLGITLGNFRLSLDWKTKELGVLFPRFLARSMARGVGR